MNEFASEMQNQEGFSNVLVANKDGDKFKVTCLRPRKRIIFDLGKMSYLLLRI